MHIISEYVLPIWPVKYVEVNMNHEVIVNMTHGPCVCSRQLIDHVEELCTNPSLVPMIK